MILSYPRFQSQHRIVSELDALTDGGGRALKRLQAETALRIRGHAPRHP